MTVAGALVVVAVVAAANPARLARAAGTAPEGTAVRRPVATGGAAAAVAVVVLALLGSSAWTWLDVSDPTGVVAAGLVLALAGAWSLLAPLPSWEPALDGGRAALLPVAVPLVLRPELALLALAAGADGHVPAVVVGMVIAVASAVGGTVESSGGDARDRLWSWAARGTGAVVVAAGVAMAVAGVYSV
ncbi:hypothetical protein [Actinomarinicola tropica]|uniref:Uncharacterized protein n=1 Tax=Actinomarinicola tropica TaxID=2789776 RepID=A0A5Q2RP46_9ACTN|nr:hypothetical protein [Actinomarinicola tropica]QGG96206.1 hypothetical protein GH723_14455 [Actinomarinicola tropica]